MRHTENTTAKQIQETLARGERVSFTSKLFLISSKKKTDESFGYWRFSYKFAGLKKTISVGLYPKISIDIAKQRASVYEEYLSLNKNPRDARKQKKGNGKLQAPHSSTYAIRNPNCFEAVALQFINDKAFQNVCEKTRKNKISRLNNHLVTTIGTKLLDDIEEKDIFFVLKELIKTRKLDTVRRVMGLCSLIFDYGISNGNASKNPCTAPRQLIPKISGGTNFAAKTTPDELADVLQKINTYNGKFPVMCALKLLPHLLVRPGNLRTAEWKEFDFVERMWLIPAAKMKGSQQSKTANNLPHYVPLTSQVIEILKELYEQTEAKLPDHEKTGKLFPSLRKKGSFMSDGTMNKALRKMGICTRTQMTAHGFRATARTMIQEQLKILDYLIELQLDHVVSDEFGKPYNRASELENRDLMMQFWSDYLTDLQTGKIKFKNKIKAFIPMTERMKMLSLEEKNGSTTRDASSSIESKIASVFGSNNSTSNNSAATNESIQPTPKKYIEGLHQELIEIPKKDRLTNSSETPKEIISKSCHARGTTDIVINASIADEQMKRLLQKSNSDIGLTSWNSYHRKNLALLSQTQGH